MVVIATILIYPIYSFVVAGYKVPILNYAQRQIKGKKILYVIAHPDDEAMFFVPSIRKLREHNKLWLMCLSNGNAAGLGKIREKELEKSCEYLGF